MESNKLNQQSTDQRSSSKSPDEQRRAKKNFRVAWILVFICLSFFALSIYNRIGV